MSFISDSKYLAHVEDSHASALIVNSQVADKLGGNLLVVDDPYLGYAKVAQLFDITPKPALGIDSSASISNKALIGRDVAICANAVVDDGAVVGDNCIMSLVFISVKVPKLAKTLVYTLIPLSIIQLK